MGDRRWRLGVSRTLIVFEDFRYVRELSGDAGGGHALVSEARIGDVAVRGCDFLDLDASGLIDGAPPEIARRLFSIGSSAGLA
jgi:hypothetical protein